MLSQIKIILHYLESILISPVNQPTNADGPNCNLSAMKWNCKSQRPIRTAHDATTHHHNGATNKNKLSQQHPTWNGTVNINACLCRPCLLFFIPTATDHVLPIGLKSTRRLLKRQLTYSFVCVQLFTAIYTFPQIQIQMLYNYILNGKWPTAHTHPLFCLYPAIYTFFQIQIQML